MKHEVLEAYSIGLKLRTLRTQKHLTLSRLATETGFSTALLSKLETNKMLPTLPTLERICRIYGIGLGYFFSEAGSDSVAITRKAHISQNGRSQQTAKIIPLHLPQPDGKTSAVILECPFGVTSTIGEYGQRNEITAYVIEGMLELNFAGDKESLEAGDCAVLETSGSVFVGARNGSTCRALIVKVRTGVS
jgi:transcriptional regulator with XRE-family HTH domain